MNPNVSRETLEVQFINVFSLLADVIINFIMYQSIFAVAFDVSRETW